MNSKFLFDKMIFKLLGKKVIIHLDLFSQHWQDKHSRLDHFFGHGGLFWALQDTHSAAFLTSVRQMPMSSAPPHTCTKLRQQKSVSINCWRYPREQSLPWLRTAEAPQGPRCSQALQSQATLATSLLSLQPCLGLVPWYTVVSDVKNGLLKWVSLHINRHP